ncbi:MAG: hypothetical protein JXD22_10085 [Sedimentisphaerales bacterium]|nr:hypothetical protein [Sedimentisphaerales bacterium]
MSIMAANLKHFYQRRGLWFWYLIILAQLPTFLMLYKKPDKPIIVGFLMINLLAGMLVASLQKDTLSKAFTFCLPGHRQLGRKFVFSVGLVLNIVFSLPFVAVLDGAALELLLLLAGIISIGMLYYFFSVMFVFRSDTYPSIPGLFWGLLFVSSFFFHSHLYLAVRAVPWGFVLAAVVMSIFAWIWLGRDSHARRLCGTIYLDIMDRWSVEKARRVRQMKEMQKRRDNSERPGWLERFTLSKMKRVEGLSRGRVLWGEFYTVVDQIMPRFWNAIVGMLVMILFYGYLFGGGMEISIGSRRVNQLEMSFMDLIYILPVIGAMQWILPVHCSLLTPAGRREKFVSGIFSAIAITAVATLMLLGLAVFCSLIQPYMPEIPNWFGKPGGTIKFVAPLISHVYLCPLLMPMGFAVGTLFGRQNAVMMFAGPLIFVFCILLNVAWLLLDVGAAWLAVATAGTWMVYVLVLRRHCMSRSLVGPGR